MKLNKNQHSPVCKFIRLVIWFPQWTPRNI